MPTVLPFEIGTSPTLKIRGVIATEAIGKDRVIEKCPIILIPNAEWNSLTSTVLKKYYFEWNKTHHCIVLGHGSLYNHSFKPNAHYVYDYPRKVLIFKALKAIKKGEEILVNYNGYADSKARLDTHYLDFNKHKPG